MLAQAIVTTRCQEVDTVASDEDWKLLVDKICMTTDWHQAAQSKLPSDLDEFLGAVFNQVNEGWDASKVHQAVQAVYLKQKADQCNLTKMR